MAGIFSRFIFNNAIFNTDGGLNPPNGNRRREYQPYTYELQKSHAERLKFKEREDAILLEIKAAELKVEVLEFRRLKRLADQKMQQELLKLLSEQQKLLLLLDNLRMQEQNRLRDEDDIFILLLSLPTY
jgi:hypothetical protein